MGKNPFKGVVQRGTGPTSEITTSGARPWDPGNLASRHPCVAAHNVYYGEYRLSVPDRGPIQRGLSVRRWSEVSAKNPQCDHFLVNLGGRANTQTPKQRQRRAPALQRMLQQKRADGRRQHQPATIYRGAQDHAGQRYGGRVGLERALDVPLASQFLDACVDGWPISAYESLQRFDGL